MAIFFYFGTIQILKSINTLGKREAQGNSKYTKLSKLYSQFIVTGTKYFFEKNFQKTMKKTQKNW